jgi:acetyl esterase/lipase
VGGGSAGGNLAAALILRARDQGLPLPAAAILLTPAVDFTHSGDTFETNFGVDTVITTRGGGSEIYARGHDVTDPYLSPIFGDYSKGFPPTLLASGTRDLLLSNTVRLHRKLRAAGVIADLHVLEAAPHGFFLGGTPEDDDLHNEIRQFIDAHCPNQAAHQTAVRKG